jgi:hypothetical protein
MVRRYNHGKHLVFMTHVRPHKIDKLPRRCPQLQANPDQEDQIQVRKRLHYKIRYGRGHHLEAGILEP